MSLKMKASDYQVFEILEELGKIQSEANKIEWLRDNFNDHTPLLRVLKFNYCDTVKSVLPPGKPPFNETESDGPARSSLWNYIRHFPIFVQSAASQKMKAIQIERTFIEMLESLDVKESLLMVAVKDKGLEELYSGINLNIARAAFPQIQIQSKAPVRVPTPEEKAQGLLDRAARLKEEAKAKNAEAKALETEAKALVTTEKPKTTRRTTKTTRKD